MKVSAPVLITGETGTGKSIVANAILAKSTMARKSLVRFSCTSCSEEQIEEELFGHEKGFSNRCYSSQRGLLEKANEGTLFLDEISELPSYLQNKILIALDNKKVRRLGSSQDIPVDVRIVATTSNIIRRRVIQSLNTGLYYHMSVIQIDIPPLREHLEDIPLLCNHLLRQIESGDSFNLESKELECLKQYDWPGNVHELKNFLASAALKKKYTSGRISPSLLLEGTQKNNKGCA